MLALFSNYELTSDGRYKEVWNGDQKMVGGVAKVRCRDDDGRWRNERMRVTRERERYEKGRKC